MTDREDGGAALKPCPFCGCSDVFHRKDDSGSGLFECDWCHATSGYDPEGDLEAPEYHWNRRYEADVSPQFVTLRDRIAIAALCGMATTAGFQGAPWDKLASDAYEAADAMLEARETATGAA